MLWADCHGGLSESKLRPLSYRYFLPPPGVKVLVDTDLKAEYNISKKREKMNIDNRENTVTITVNLESLQSVRDAINFLKEQASLHVSNRVSSAFITNKVKIIKLMRKYGSDCEAGFIEAGLKSAKDAVESQMRDISLPLSSLIENEKYWED